MTTAQVIPINSICTLCGGSGWRYLTNNRVVRCQCRGGPRPKVVSITDHKSRGAGER